MDLGLTQRTLARQLGVCLETVALWENGRAKPLARRYPAIVRLLGYEPEPADGTPGGRLRTLRLRLGLTQRELATRLGLDPSTVADLEHGRRRVSRRTAELTAKSLRLPGSEGEPPLT